MKTNWKVSLVAVIATIMSMGAVAAEKTFNIDGDAEYDITHQKTTAKGASSSTKSFTEGGRIKLNAKARINQDNGSFVEAVVQPLFGFSNGRNNATDDTYIKFGKKAWDIQLGRFEGIDLFPLGRDTVANKADGKFGYSANIMRGRDTGVDTTYTKTDGSKTVVPVVYADGHPVQGAAHFNIGKTQVELGGSYGEKNGVKATGIRPVVKFDAGRFRVAAGYDYGKCKQDSNASGTCAATGEQLLETKGFGITAGTTMFKDTPRSFDANFNIAQGRHSGTTAAGVAYEDEKRTSYGVNMTRGRFGAGYVHDKQNRDGGNDNSADRRSIAGGGSEVGGNFGGKEDMLYAAYKVPLMGTKNAHVTFAASTAKAKYNDGTTAKDTSARVRFNYDF
ncbi:carbohydrate porin [Thiofilum flexile]|uniref:carbohydrate porin n=1 Tax=Thiofilum flexile TaxID=125627 RepID=UPI00036E2A89|nr:carbohydrate porin [Thiofilum flexile]